MKRRKFSASQIFAILKQVENGVRVSELCRAHSMSRSPYYTWWSKYGGMDASMMSEMKALQAENNRLKRIYGDLSMQHDEVKEALSKK